MKSILRSFALVVGMPTLIAAIYFGFIASDMYVSESRFAVRASKSEAASGLAGLLSSTSVISAGGQDSRIVIDYIQSHDMLSTLDEALDVTGHFSDPSIDFISRIDSNPPREELLEHYLKHLEIIEDGGSDILVLRVKAYSPEFAQGLSQKIIALSEALVNDMSARIEQDGLDSAKEEVAIAAEKVREATENLTAFRQLNTSINPAEETSALLGLLSGLETKLSTARTELSEKRAFMKESSPLVKTLKNRVAAIERQLGQEKQRMAGSDGQGMNQLINQYQPLALDQELAQQQYTSALTSLELARIEGQRKKRYLITYIRPMMAEQSTEPKRLMKTLTVLVYSFLFFAIGGLMWSALRDHIGH